MQTKTTHDNDKHDKENIWNNYKSACGFFCSDFLVHDVHRLKLNPFNFIGVPLHPTTNDYVPHSQILGNRCIFIMIM